MAVFNFQSSSSIPTTWSLSKFIHVPVPDEQCQKKMAVSDLAFGYMFQVVPSEHIM